MSQKDSPSQLIIQEEQFISPMIPFCGGTLCAFTQTSPSRSSNRNEDSMGWVQTTRDSGIFFVSDGVGGGASGDKASELAVKEMLNTLQKASPQSKSHRELILDGFENANHKILDLGIGASCTLSVIEVQKNWVRAYHVGDSPILIVGQKGRLKYEATLHSPTGYAKESGLMDLSASSIAKHQHIVSNVVGSAEMKIEIGPTIELALKDTVLISSDGVADNLHDEERIELIRKGTLEEVQTQILKQVSERMNDPQDGQPSKPDDATLILFRR